MNGTASKTVALDDVNKLIIQFQQSSFKIEHFNNGQALPSPWLSITKFKEIHARIGQLIEFAEAG